jgi:hypothetical protein
MRAIALATLLSFAVCAAAESGHYPVTGDGRIGHKLYTSDQAACETGIYDVANPDPSLCIKFYPGSGC